MPVAAGAVPAGTPESRAPGGNSAGVRRIPSKNSRDCQGRISRRAVVIAGLILLSGCAQTGSQTSGGPAGRTEFTDIALNAIVVNAGSSRGYTVFQHKTILVTVLADSSARIVFTSVSPPGFENAHERLKWIEAGKPQFPLTSPAGAKNSLPAGNFSFLPFPPLLSFRQAAALTPSPGKITSTVLGSSRLSVVSERKFYAAMQLGTLLATAPLRADVRRAAWKALVSLATIQGCSGGRDRAGRTGLWMCVSSSPDELKILTNTRDQRVLCVEELLIAPSLRYPGVPVGSVIQSSTYLTSRANERSGLSAPAQLQSPYLPSLIL
jgi:hypothetical protein